MGNIVLKGCVFFFLLSSTCIRVIIFLRREGMRDKDLLKLLIDNGWELDRVRGSHHILKKGNKVEVVPVHGRDVPKGMLNKILKHTGLK